ncbi:MAG: DNA polymerase III subunit gamma/tau [Bacteroidales bacterium]|nr:DNA polymerase III subunit gamma/tau [Bacteroidales bacterium]
MSEYIVSARKYRPMSFDTVVGQGAIATTLKNAIRAGKLAHAYLFCGPRGVGKTTCARIFAKTINCLNPREDGEACNECESCRAFNEQRSLNIHELDAASNNSVDDIRALVDQVRVPPQIGKYKVFIIDEVHMLSTSAFNAFLKTLEEPPAHAIFILATTEKHKILPTILSRCQIYDFQRMTIENTVQHLAHVAEKEGYTFEPAALNVIAQKADGGMRDALSIFDQVVSYTGGDITYQRVIENLNVLDYDYYFRLVDMMLEQKISESLLLYNEVLGKGFEGGPFISGLASHLRDLLVSRDAQTTTLLEASGDVRQRYAEQAQRCRPKWLYRAIRLCNDCDLAYRTSRNKRLQVELALIECAQAVTDDDVSAGRRPVRRLKPIFSLLAQGAKEAPAVAATGQSAIPSSSDSSHSVPGTAALPSAEVARDSRSASPQSPSLQGAPTGNTPSRRLGGEVPSSSVKHQTLKLGALNPTIHQQRVATHGPMTHVSASPTAPTPNNDFKPFTQADVSVQWQAFIRTMPQAETALSKNMLIIQPVLQEDGKSILIVADNSEVEKMLQEKAAVLLPFFRERLHNNAVTLRITVKETRDKEPVSYDKRQQLRHLCDLNPSLITLGKNFSLELT